jgi:hypothetical protein
VSSTLDITRPPTTWTSLPGSNEIEGEKRDSVPDRAARRATPGPARDLDVVLLADRSRRIPPFQARYRPTWVGEKYRPDYVKHVCRHRHQGPGSEDEVVGGCALAAASFLAAEAPSLSLDHRQTESAEGNRPTGQTVLACRGTRSNLRAAGGPSTPEVLSVYQELLRGLFN